MEKKAKYTVSRTGTARTPAPKKVNNLYTVPNITDKLTETFDEAGNVHPKIYKCTVCGITTNKIADKTFPPSFSNLFIAWEYHLPICTDCLNKLYDTYTVKYQMSEEEAVKRICSLYDIYYNPSIVETMKSNSKPGQRMSFYINRTRLSQYANKTYANTIAEEKAQIKEESELSVPQDEGVKKKDQNFWGMGFTKDDIDFLNNKFNEWVQARGCDDHSQEVIYRQISMLELQILRGMQSGQSTAPLQKQLNDFMNSGKLQPKQNDEAAFVEANTFGTFIKKIENTRPISEPAEEWKDVDRVKHYIFVWFLGHLCKMIGITNKWSKAWDELYEKEVERFTVNPPTYFDTDGEAPSFDDVFNK